MHVSVRKIAVCFLYCHEKNRERNDSPLGLVTQSLWGQNTAHNNVNLSVVSAEVCRFEDKLWQ